MDQQTIADYPVGGAATTPTFRYVYASYIDEPVVRKTAGTGGTLVYFHRNHQYSVTAITTSTGAIAERYAYTAYGQPTILDASASVLSSSAINNRYTYTGREWDATLALYHFRARWMSPSAGRFLTRDPIGFEGGDSLYAYVENKPLRWLDPKGTNPLTFARVVFSVLSIASSVNTIRKHLDDKNPASWPSPFANDYRIPSTFNFEGTPGGKGTNNTPCPCDGKSAVLMDERWCNAFACDTYKITVKFNYCEGGMSGHTIATGSNSMYRVAHVTETVNGHSYGLSNRCGCHKEIPCVNVDFVVRRFVDEPWPIWDWEEAPMVGFTACADGTLSVH
jgi:RHS repeat-associated protein